MTNRENSVFPTHRAIFADEFPQELTRIRLIFEHTLAWFFGAADGTSVAVY
jgi:hypothetical protein